MLNQGTINVVNWYTPGAPKLALTNRSDPGGATQGFNLVGNPYASSIDWNNFGTTAGSGIQGIDVSNFFYILNPGGNAGSGNYAIWFMGSAAPMVVTNIIPSGAGFFVQANDANAQLIFFGKCKS